MRLSSEVVLGINYSMGNCMKYCWFYKYKNTIMFSLFSVLALLSNLNHVYYIGVPFILAYGHAQDKKSIHFGGVANDVFSTVYRGPDGIAVVYLIVWMMSFAVSGLIYNFLGVSTVSVVIIIVSLVTFFAISCVFTRRCIRWVSVCSLMIMRRSSKLKPVLSSIFTILLSFVLLYVSIVKYEYPDDGYMILLMVNFVPCVAFVLFPVLYMFLLGNKLR